jgi:hypothetical protein
MDTLAFLQCFSMLLPRLPNNFHILAKHNTAAMQTRRSRAAQQQQQQHNCAVDLPLPIQLAILDHVVASFPVPDADYTSLWPYRSSLDWLLSLHTVCSAWSRHLHQQPTLLRRLRLERLHDLSLLHDFAYYITSSSKSKQARIKGVPRSISLPFADGSSITLDVPRGGVAGAAKQQRHAASSGLPTHALMLVVWSHQVSSTALLELLADLDTLDKQHAAPMILQVRAASTDSSSVSAHNSSSSSQHKQQEPQLEAHRAGLSVLEAAVGPVLSGVLRDVVQEGDSSSEALTFIPTKRGFCRRVQAV